MTKRISSHENFMQKHERLWTEKRDQSAVHTAEAERPPLRGKALVEALQRCFQATADPAFEDALLACAAYGLDKGKPGAIDDAHENVWGDSDEGYLVQMQFSLSVKERYGAEPDEICDSDRKAAVIVAARFGARGHSFESTWERLRKKYPSWVKNRSDQIGRDVGDLGYRVCVEPAPGAETGIRALCRPGTSLESQPASHFWRRRFRDGSVSLRRLAK